MGFIPFTVACGVASVFCKLVCKSDLGACTLRACLYSACFLNFLCISSLMIFFSRSRHHII